MKKPPERRRLPETRQSITHRVELTDPSSGVIDVYLIVGLYENGTPGELFIKCGKAGSTMQGLLDTIGIETSLLLQFGIPLQQITDKLRGQKFVPEGATDNPKIPAALSVVDYVFSWLNYVFEGEEDSAET